MQREYISVGRLVVDDGLTGKRLQCHNVMTISVYV